MTPPWPATRICIITPGQIGSNPRAVKEAGTLHAAGHDVTVIATRTLDLVEPRDQAILRAAGWRLTRISLRSRPLWRVRRAVQRATRVLYQATGHQGFADSGFSAVTRPLTAAALSCPAALYIAHYPAALPAAVAAARRHGAAYAYDAEDFHHGEWPQTPAFDVERALVHSIESRHLPGAAYISAASPGIAEAYAKTYGVAPPHVLLNTFPLAEAPAAPAGMGTARPGPSLYWFSQTIGPDRGLECAVRAIGVARTRPHLYLRGTPVSGFVERLQRIAAETGALDRLHLLPPDAPDKMAVLAAAYDLGLCAEPGHTRLNDVAVSNKLLTFLLAGVPPLMSATSGQLAFAGDAGLRDFIYPINDGQALAERLDTYLSDPARLAAARRQAWALGQTRYNWDHQSAVLLALVTGARLA